MTASGGRKKISHFKATHGCPANLEAPKTFSEKLLKRILADEDPLYDLYAVKHVAHYFVRALGIEGLKVARHLKVLGRIGPEDFADLPDSFLIKSSFGSGLNEVVADKSELNIPDVCKRFNSAMAGITNAQNRSAEKNVIIIEEFIGDPKTGTPDDYKFHCFNASNGAFSDFIQVDSDRFGDHRQTIFDQNFQPVEM